MSDVRKTEMPGGGVLLEPQPHVSEPLPPKVECAVCWEALKKHRPAVVALKDDPIRFTAIDVHLEQPYMGLCHRHAQKIQKTLKKRIRRVQRYSTNLYAQEQ